MYEYAVLDEMPHFPVFTSTILNAQEKQKTQEEGIWIWC